MNKLLKSLMLLTAIMLIGSVVVYAEFKGSSHSNRELMEENIDNKQESGQLDQQEKSTLQAIAEVVDTENRLYPVRKSEGLYEGFILHWDNKTADFNWKSIASPAAPAELFSGDVTGDGIKDAIITLPAGDGTGVYLEDVHVVNGKTLREEQVEDAVYAAKKWLVLGKELISQEELLLNHIDYQMNENEQLTALIGVATSPLQYVGELALTYVYNDEKEKLMIDSISYTAF